MKIIVVILVTITCLYTLYTLLHLAFILLNKEIQTEIRKCISSFILEKTIYILPVGEFKKSFCQFIVNNEHKLNQ